jgi:hypothetical protein
MVFLAGICKKKKMLVPEKKGLAPELFLVLSTPDHSYCCAPLSETFRLSCTFLCVSINHLQA